MDTRLPRLCLASLGALVACATPGMTDQELEALVRDLSGAGPEVRVLVLNAEDDEAAWVRVTEAHNYGPLDASRRLAGAFEPAARRGVEYVVGGPYPQLNDRVLIDAFEICKEPRLPGLEVIVVSPRPPGDELQDTARAYRARLLHRVYVEPEPPPEER